MDSDDDATDRAYHFNKNPRKIYVSRSFPPNPQVPKMRYVSQVIDHDEGLAFVTTGDEAVLKTTPSGRIEVRATVVEDDRRVKSVLVQKFDSKSGPSAQQHFTFGEAAIAKLLHLFSTIGTMSLEHDGKIHLSSEEIGNVVLDRRNAERLFENNEELFVSVAENTEELARDLTALGYRRKTLRTFERMLSDVTFFESEGKRLGKTGEAVWQAFFEANTWIFGYGLCYQFLSGLDERKLEQVVVGYDFARAGKRADALMVTQARINSLCYVEVKRHDTDLVRHPAYRGDAWAPSKDLSGGVAQVQATVQSAIEQYSRSVQLTNEDGDPIGGPLFNFDPRAFLVIGNLSEFTTADGRVNASKFRSFELFRRNVRRPEIITFDELLNRARFIVGTEETTDASDSDVPF